MQEGRAVVDAARVALEQAQRAHERAQVCISKLSTSVALVDYGLTHL